MYGKLVSVMYVTNIIFQAFITLLIPAGLGWLCSWLLVTYASCPTWVYAPLIVLGVLVGFYSMIKFVLTAMSGYERLEKEIATSKSARESKTAPNGTASKTDLSEGKDLPANPEATSDTHKVFNSNDNIIKDNNNEEK